MTQVSGVTPRSGRRLRILVLAPFPPRLDGWHGGSRAIAHSVAALAERHAVALAYLRAEDEPAASPELFAACELMHEGSRSGYSTSAIRPWPRVFALLPSLIAGRPLWVAARWNARFAGRTADLVSTWRPDVVQAEYSAMAPYLGAARQHGARCVVVIHEPGTASAQERIERRERGSLFWRLDRSLWERFEQSTLQWAHATVVFTERDRMLLQRLEPSARLERIPLGVAVPAAPADPLGTGPPTLLFFGNFSHPPNRDAAEWLMDEIYPALRRRFAALQLSIVGANPPAAWLEPMAEGVIVTGAVASLESYLQAAAVVIAPLRQGGGMRVKVLESLAAGKALVATPLAVAGLDLEPGRHALVAERGEDVIEAIATLLEDPERRAELARAGRAWVASRFGWARTAAAYEALYERLLAGPGVSAGAVS